MPRHVGHTPPSTVPLPPHCGQMSSPADAVSSGTSAGVLIAAWAVGSLSGGLVYGARRLTGEARRRLVLLHLALAVTALPLALGGGITPMTFACLVAGLPLASAAACLYALVAELAPAGAETEANTWLISGIVGGLALGGVASGVLVEGSGPTSAFAAAAAVFLVAAGAAHAGRGRLAPQVAKDGTAPVASAA